MGAADRAGPLQAAATHFEGCAFTATREFPTGMTAKEDNDVDRGGDQVLHGTARILRKTRPRAGRVAGQPNSFPPPAQSAAFTSSKIT